MLRQMLRDLRLAAGLSVCEAARRIGVKRNAVHCWETEGQWRKRPSPASLGKALNVYGATLDARARVWEALSLEEAAA